MQIKNGSQVSCPGQIRCGGERPDKNKNFTDPYFSNDRPDEGSDLGDIMVHHGVIAVIARIAALKVPGVVEMSGSFTDGIANMIGRNSGERGVRVDLQGQNVDLEVNIVIEYGAKIPQVAWAVQNEVRRAIEEMTGKKVGAVNILIQGVKMLSETKEQGGKT
jgi:uncharacterized alkaline shock family protein YloU